MDPAQVMELASKLAALGSQLAPLLTVVGQVGIDGAIKAGRVLSGLDGQLSEVMSLQRANAEADRLTLERVQALELAVGRLTDQVAAGHAADRVTDGRVAMLERTVGELRAGCAVKHANGGGES